MKTLAKAHRWLVPVMYGGVTLGILQAVSDVNFNNIWFNFLTTLLSLLVALLLGGDVNALGTSGSLRI